MNDLTRLPEWVWKVVDATVRYEDEHPQLFRQNVDDTYSQWPCLGDELLGLIPADVYSVANVFANRRTRGDLKTAEEATAEADSVHDAVMHVAQTSGDYSYPDDAPDDGIKLIDMKRLRAAIKPAGEPA